MRITDLGRYALGVCAAAMLASCGGGSSTPLSPSPAGLTAERTRAHPAYSVIYSFKGGSGDGKFPTSTLINVQGALYGTTDEGGGTKCRHQGCGTVFTITTSGTETVLHSFRGSEHGIVPVALLDVNRKLYGTTLRGGANEEGTVFAITRSGKETVLHSFGGSGDGDYPRAPLINVKGTFYGTTAEGGANGDGTVFSITMSGGETVLHSFGGGSGDGSGPEAALTNVNGTLYGTTYAGGSGSCIAGSFSGCGTVFSITTSGKERMLYSFKGARHKDGADPEAALINVNGTLYGTTYAGGSGSCSSSASGCGTVFAVTPSGKETVLYRFGGSPDGSEPVAGLINVNGTLYGTNSFGGANCGNCGTVFAITASGAETVLHSFGAGSRDGYAPFAGLIDVDGTLYGTTAFGGANVDGTVFSLSP